MACNFAISCLNNSNHLWFMVLVTASDLSSVRTKMSSSVKFSTSCSMITKLLMR